MLTRTALAIIGLYQAAVSPYLPGLCRYSPSCSHYAREAIAGYGFAKGAALAAKRLARCRPFGGRGYDPVP